MNIVKEVLNMKELLPILSIKDLSEWDGSITLFGGFKNTTPTSELNNAKWLELSKLIAPSNPLILEDKTQGTYLVPCELKIAEFVGKTREFAIKNNQSTKGKMRSKSHVTDAKFVIMDVDGLDEDALLLGLKKVKSDGLTYLAYSTHSHGSTEKPGMRIRLILLLDRTVNVDDYALVWHGIDQHYFNGRAGDADTSGANMYQQQGTWCCHPNRVNEAHVWRNDDGIACADRLIAIGVDAVSKKGFKPLARDSHTNMPMDVHAFIPILSKDYPPSDLNKVADACKQLGQFRDSKGANQSEPQWRDCLGVTAFGVNGNSISHLWSSGHDEYDRVETSRKITHRIQFAPTTCNQFKRTNPAGCVGCIETCNSPITLGWTDQNLLGFTPTETVIVDNTNSKVSPKLDSRSEALEAMQKQFALIQIGGKVWVIEGNVLNTHDNNGAIKKLELLNRGDGALLIHRALTAQFPIQTNKVIEEFMLSPHTICYKGVEFNPRETTANYLNLWVGPTVMPQSGEWGLIQAFLLTGICNGNQECYFYLIRYIAHALQKPWEKPGVMVILIGGQGLGKGTLGQILRKIWRATYLQVNNIDNVTGNFNASLERAFIVFMDEALLSGDRKATNALKSLVTEPVVHINEKHQPSRQTDSYLRIFLATNAEHVKNTERDDRRDFVLSVSEEHKGDKAYWEALYHEIENGGVEAMVCDLLALELSDFNVRYKPNTPELVAQKLQSLNPIEIWWHDCLYRGQICKEDGDFIAESEKGWPAFISTHTAIEGVMNVTGGRAYRKPTTNDIVDSIKRLCPSAVNKQSQSGKVRHRGLGLPTLEQARQEFETYIGDSVPWPF